MKLVGKLLVGCMILLHTAVFSQPSNDKPLDLSGDGDTEIDSEKNNHKRGNWSGFELGVSGLVGEQSNFMNPSFMMNFNSFDRKFKFGENENWGFTTGLGFGVNFLGVSKGKDLNFNNDSVWFSSSLVGNYKQNYFTRINLNVPVLLDFNQIVDGKKKSYFAAGFIASVNLFNNWTTYRKLQYGNLQTDLSGRFKSNWVNLDATIRAGYKHIGFFATYGLIPIFNQSNTSNQFTTGISITFKD
jgi:hypothetical protein